MVGHYNVLKLLGVIAAHARLGVPLADAVARLRAASARAGPHGATGLCPAEPLVAVDYAHTPDALEKALQALRPLAQQRGGATVVRVRLWW